MQQVLVPQQIDVFGWDGSKCRSLNAVGEKPSVLHLYLAQLRIAPSVLDGGDLLDCLKRM